MNRLLLVLYDYSLSGSMIYCLYLVYLT